jgi:hypothetical protein
VDGLVALPLRRWVFLRPGAFRPIFLLETIAWILVRTAGTPLAAAALRALWTALTPIARRRRSLLPHLKIGVLLVS